MHDFKYLLIPVSSLEHGQKFYWLVPKKDKEEDFMTSIKNKREVPSSWVDVIAVEEYEDQFSYNTGLVWVKPVVALMEI